MTLKMEAKELLTTCACSPRNTHPKSDVKVALMGTEPTTRHGFNTGFSELVTAVSALSKMSTNYGWEFSALLRSFNPTISIMGSDGEGRKPTAS